MSRKSEDDDMEMLGRASLYRLISLLTCGQQKMKHCVDYCLGVLLFENVRTLENITKDLVRDVRERTQLLYVMPVRYAECIEGIFREAPNMKPADVEKLSMQLLNVDSNSKLIDFPSTRQIWQRSSSVKAKIRKDNGGR